MSDVLIEAHELGKLYHRGYFAKRGKHRGSDAFWALKDIDLELRAGEALGIIGPNGAGKSTLLKILSRVTVPTEGWMTIRGRVGALIELGAGFHPELSGRDNVYIAGSILGMPRKEITRRFEEIVEFAEIGEFIDMPVKKYSSGMYVRLGFAVAAHMDPDILLVDEVLAVGDGGFQKKCFNAMERFREQGVTVLLVSHSMYNIQRNCRKGLLLLGGRVAYTGEVDTAIAKYQEVLNEYERENRDTLREVDALQRSCSGQVTIEYVRLTDSQGRPTQRLVGGETVKLVLGYRVHDSVTAMHVEVAVHSTDGTRIALNHSYLDGVPVPLRDEEGEIEIVFPAFSLTSGSYLLHVALYDAACMGRYDVAQGIYRDDLCLTIVPDAKSVAMEQWRGLVNLECRWSWASSVVAD